MLQEYNIIEKVGYNIYNKNMSRISEIVAQLNTLPKGYISKKIIHNKVYFYLQKKNNGKLISEYIKESDVKEIENKLKKRTKLEKELRTLLNTGKVLKEPSKNAQEYTGYLMSKDTKVIEFDKGEIIYVNEQLCPLYFKRYKDIQGFLKKRAIDQTRTNSRLLKKVLGIKTNEEDKISLYANGATITDDYWFKPKGSKLTYKDVSFDGDFYSDLSLKGEVIVYPKTPRLTPDITTPGSYEKCWKKENGEWWLYKKGNEEELFSEMFCARLAEKMKIPTAHYELSGSEIKTRNFADKQNFEPMSSIAGEDDSYDNVFDELYKLDKRIAKEYIRLVFFDALVNNVDRHNENCGVMRERKTGKTISLAPNFDDNVALISRSKILNMDASKDGFISYFVKFLKSNDKAAKIYKEMKFPILNEKLIDSCFKEIEIKEDSKSIKNYLLNRYKYLTNIRV